MALSPGTRLGAHEVEYTATPDWRRLRPGRYNRPVVLRFFVDPSTGEPHIHGHNVNEDEVEAVIYVPDPVPASAFVITAYDLGPKALKALRRRRKKS